MLYDIYLSLSLYCVYIYIYIYTMRAVCLHAFVCLFVCFFVCLCVFISRNQVSQETKVKYGELKRKISNEKLVRVRKKN